MVNCESNTTSVEFAANIQFHILIMLLLKLDAEFSFGAFKDFHPCTMTSVIHVCKVTPRRSMGLV